jgi:broad specificity phosphatase PhoE
VGVRLLLVRHGQTEANVRMALDSAPPGPPLTEQGERQAAELAGSLAAEPLVAVYASTALRAQQTAAPVAAGHGLAVEVLDGVHEVGVGDLEGNTDHDSMRTFLGVFTAWAGGDLAVPMPGGETGEQVFTRFRAAVAGIRERHRDGSVVLVSHGGVIRLAAPLLAPNAGASLTGQALLPNTGRVILAEDRDAEGGWRCVEWTGVQLPTG